MTRADEIVKLHHEGLSNPEIAGLLGVSRQYVGQALKRREGKRYTHRRSSPVEIIRRYAPTKDPRALLRTLERHGFVIVAKATGERGET